MTSAGPVLRPLSRQQPNVGLSHKNFLEVCSGDFRSSLSGRIEQKVSQSIPTDFFGLAPFRTGESSVQKALHLASLLPVTIETSDQPLHSAPDRLRAEQTLSELNKCPRFTRTFCVFWEDVAVRVVSEELSDWSLADLVERCGFLSSLMVRDIVSALLEVT